MTNLNHYTETHDRRRGFMALVLFTLAAALLVAAMAEGDLGAAKTELAAPAAQTAIPDWHGNSAHLPQAE